MRNTRQEAIIAKETYSRSKVIEVHPVKNHLPQLFMEWISICLDEIFESSEVDEKRQLLNFVFQNFELKNKKLSVTLREPFKIIKDTSLAEKCPGMCPSPILHRTNLSRG